MFKRSQIFHTLSLHQWEELLAFRPQCPFCKSRCFYIGRGRAKGCECAVYVCSNPSCRGRGNKRVGYTLADGRPVRVF